MRLAARRFPDTITRRREMAGHRDDFGEWIPGATEDATLRARVQPLALTDSDLEGGVQLQQRLKVFVLPRRERVSDVSAALTLHGEVLTLRGATLTLGAGTEVSDAHALAAAYAQAGADRVQVAGEWFVVIESRTWPNFTRATILRET